MANRRIKQPCCEQADNSAMSKTGTSRIADLAAWSINIGAVDSSGTWSCRMETDLNRDISGDGFLIGVFRAKKPDLIPNSGYFSFES
jgi:hypothetical protein